jgi:hypothetical protein
MKTKPDMEPRSNSDFDVKCVSSFTIIVIILNPTIGSGWILRGVSWHVVLPWVKISSQSEFGKAPQYWSTQALQILLFTSFWLVNFLFG